MFVTCAVACDSVSHEQLQTYYSQWLDRKNNNYQYLIQKQCFCSPEYTRQLIITVDNDKVLNVVDKETGQEVSEKVFLQQRTIAEWYRLAFKYVDAEFGVLNIEVDKKNAMPSSIYIDQHKMRADDEYTLYISELKNYK